MSVWFEGVGSMMLNIIFHLKPQQFSTGFEKLNVSKQRYPIILIRFLVEVDFPPCSSLRLWCLGQALTLSLPIRLVVHGRGTSRHIFCAIYAGSTRPY